MNIGIDIRNIGRKRTGDEVVFLNLVCSLARIDDVNEYRLFIDSRTEEELENIAVHLGVKGNVRFRFVSLPAKNKFDWNLFYAPRAIRQEELDVYHTQYIVPFFVSRRTKVVTHIHDVSFKALPHLIAPLDRFFLATVLPMSLSRADAVVAVSEFTRSEILKYYPVSEEKVTVVPNAVSDDFVERVTDEQHVKSKYSLPETYILYVGTLQPRKNIPFLVEVFSRLRERLPDISLVLVGNRHGHHFDARIDGMVTSLGLETSVLFPGFIDAEDLPMVMRGARAFAYPSFYEGFGIPLLEAMRVGVPVVASDIPPLREAGGDAAIYANVSGSDIAGFVDSLYTAATLEGDSRTAFLQKGFERSRFFSWKESARKLLEVYGRIAG